MTDASVPRWHDRLRVFERTVELLDEGVALGRQRALSDLEKAGLIQRFETAWQSGWTLMADYLTEELTPPSAVTAMMSIREAAHAGVIDDVDGWAAAGKARNTLSHMYSEYHRDRALEAIEDRFAPLFATFARDMRGAA